MSNKESGVFALNVPQKVPIPGYPYYVTIDGEVFRDGSKVPLKVSEGMYGFYVTLYNKSGSKKFRIGNLMSQAYFNGVRLPLKHLDGNKRNFSYYNLKPMPRNMIPKAERPNGWSSKAVIEILPDGTENIYASAAECARHLGVSPTNIRYLCRGERKNHINSNTYRYEDDLYSYKED